MGRVPDDARNLSQASRVSAGRKVAIACGALAVLLVAALLGGWYAIHLETTKWRGDLTTASLSLSLSNELLDDASCRRATGAEARRWTCRVYVADDSGSTYEANYSVGEREDGCWTATEIRDDGRTSDRALAPGRVSGCVMALESTDRHGLID